jgi:hypothetical protein
MLFFTPHSAFNFTVPDFPKIFPSFPNMGLTEKFNFQFNFSFNGACSGGENCARAIISKIMGFAIVGVTGFILPWLFFEARRCGLEISRGQYFSAHAVRSLRNFVWGGFAYILGEPACFVIANACLGMFIPGAQVAKLTLQSSFAFHLVGHATDVVITPDSIMLFLYVLILAVIASVMSRAAWLADEHAQIV